MTPHNLSPRHLLTVAIICALAGLALLWAVDASAQDRPLKAALASYAALSVLDARQTGACLGAGTCRETNVLLRPLSASPSALVTVKLAANAGVVVALWKLRKTRPKTALGLAIAAATAQGVVVASNARRGKR